MDTCPRAISVGTCNPLSEQCCRLGDEWAAVGTFSDLQDLTYDEDLSLTSDIVINTSSIPEMMSGGSCTTPDTDEVKPVQQNDKSRTARFSPLF